MLIASSSSSLQVFFTRLDPLDGTVRREARLGEHVRGEWRTYGPGTQPERRVSARHADTKREPGHR